MYDIIVNPTAGGKLKKKILSAISQIESYLIEHKKKYTIHKTEKRGHAKELTAECIKNGATDIVVIGGDGTLHEVINGFSNFEKVNLGIIPCGTGNDFASALNLPFDTEKAIDLIVNGTPKYTDFMQMPTVRGLNIIGMGIDVEVLKKYASLKKKTKFGYTKSLVKALMDFEYSDFDAEIDGKVEHFRSFIACIANGHRYGGGIPICPVACATDNKLDFVAVREMKKLKIIGAFLKLKAGKILTVKQSVHKNIQEIKIKTNGDYTVEVDGELYENIPFEVKIVSNTLKVYR